MIIHRTKSVQNDINNNKKVSSNDDFDPLAASVANLLSQADVLIKKASEQQSSQSPPPQPQQVLPEPVCSEAPAPLLTSLLFYAPLALDFVYRSDPLEIQLLAAQQVSE
tara:strand:+ start:1014 stop:1340 length:327 start_codon:yes stop_codon:yes gene_type:complete